MTFITFIILVKIKLYVEDFFLHFILINKRISHSHYSKTIISCISCEIKLLKCIHVFYYPCIFENIYCDELYMLNVIFNILIFDIKENE